VGAIEPCATKQTATQKQFPTANTFSHQLLQPPDASTRRWAKRPGNLKFSDLKSGVRVTCDAGYLCANFGLPRPLCCRLRPDVRDSQSSDVRQKHRV